MKVNGDLEFLSGSAGEITNVILEKRGGNPTTDVNEGRIYYHTTNKTFYYFDGSNWQSFGSDSWRISDADDQTILRVATGPTDTGLDSVQGIIPTSASRGAGSVGDPNTVLDLAEDIFAITGLASVDTSRGTIINVTAGGGGSDGDGGNITFTAGSTASTSGADDAGDITLTAGASTASSGSGAVAGAINITAGRSDNSTDAGAVVIVAGENTYGAAGAAGGVVAITGGASSQNAGNVVLTGGYGTLSGGQVNLVAGDASGSTPGSINLTGGTSGAGGGGQISLSGGSSSNSGFGAGDVVVRGGAGASNANPGDLTLGAGDVSSGNSPGGSVSLYATDGGGTGTQAGGAVTITAGDSGGSGGAGGGITLTAGDGATSGGHLLGYAGDNNGLVSFHAGATSTVDGARLLIHQTSTRLESGDSTSAGVAGGNLFVNSGTGLGAGDGGDLTIGAGDGGATGDGGNVSVEAGDAAGGTGGNVELVTGNGSVANGAVTIRVAGTGAGDVGELRLLDIDKSEYIGFKVADAVSSSISYTLPAAPGSDGYLMASTTAGVMSWVDPNDVGRTRLEDLDDVTAATAGSPEDADNSFLVYNTVTDKYESNSPADSRDALGLVAGGAGDIWVEKAGDTMTGDLTMDTGAQVLLDASAAATAPSLAWDSDPNTGIYHAGTDVLGLSAAGGQRMAVAETYISAQVQLRHTTSGGAATPSMSFNGDTDTGIFRVAADSMGAAANGTQYTQLSYNGGSPYFRLMNSAQLQLFATGSAAAPGLGFSTDTNTGVFRVEADVLGITAGGVERMRVYGTDVGSPVPDETGAISVEATSNYEDIIGDPTGVGFTAPVDDFLPNAQWVDLYYLRKSGGTMTGNLVMTSGTDITLPDAPVLATDAANKNYVDNLAVSGALWIDPISNPDLVGIADDEPTAVGVGYGKELGAPLSSGLYIAYGGAYPQHWTDYDTSATVDTVTAATDTIVVSGDVTTEFPAGDFIVHTGGAGSPTVSGVYEIDSSTYIAGSPGYTEIVTVEDITTDSTGGTIYATMEVVEYDAMHYTFGNWEVSSNIDSASPTRFGVGIFTDAIDNNYSLPVELRAGQDETNYDGSGDNGTFAGGSGHATSDVITMSDGSTVRVDAESTGTVTEFTITTVGLGVQFPADGILTQSSTTGGGTDFTLTPGFVGGANVRRDPLTDDIAVYVAGVSGNPLLSASWDFPHGKACGCVYDVDTVTAATKTFEIDSAEGDVTNIFHAGNEFVYVGAGSPSPSSGTYTIASVAYSGSPLRTVVVVDETVPADAVGGTVESPIKDGSTTLVNNQNDSHFGQSFLYNQTNMEWYQIAGPGAVDAGVGLYYSGTTLNIGLGRGIADRGDAEGIAVDLYNPSSGALILTENGTDRSTADDAKLHLRVGSTSGLDQGVTGLSVKTPAQSGLSVDASGVAVDPDTATGIRISGVDGQLELFNIPNSSMADPSWDLTDGNTTRAVTLGDELTVTGGIVGAESGSPESGDLKFYSIEDADGDTYVRTATGPTNDADTVEVVLGDAGGNYPAGTVVSLAPAALAINALDADTATAAGATLTLTSGDGNTSGAGGAIAITSGAGGASGVGGNITLTSGGGTSAGDIILQGGTGSSVGGDIFGTAGNIGSVRFRSGADSPDRSYSQLLMRPSDIFLEAADATGGNEDGAILTMTSGNGNGTGSGGTLTVLGGTGGASGDGGTVNISGGSASGGTAGSVNLLGGDGSTNGTVNVKGAGSGAGDVGVLRIYDADSTNYIGLTVADVVTSSLDYTLPEAPAQNDYLLKSQTDGTLAWVDPATVGATRIEDLNDVTASTSGSPPDDAGNVLVSDGTNSYDTQAIQFNYDSTLHGGASTSHTVTHNLGQQFVNVTVYEAAGSPPSTYSQIIPDSVDLTSANQLTVTFGQSIDCVVVVMGVPGVPLA